MSHLGRRSWRPLVAALVAVVAGALVLAAPGTAGAVGKQMSPVVAASDAGVMKSHVKGTTEDGRRLKGTFTPSEFSVEGGKVLVDGTLDYVLLGKGKPEAHSVQQTFTVEGISTPGAMGAGGPGMAGTAIGSCDILNLDLGPLDLDLLGLQVHLDKVVLDIVAQSGAGNLLGNLLCAVAGLLDGTSLGGLLEGVLTQISDLLNQILGALQL